MADRYLLESSSVDGYLLEDSSGVLLLDAPPALAPDGGEDSGAWGILQSAVIGGVVAAGLALSSGNARAAANSYQDEVPFETGNGVSYSQPYTQRAQVKPVFIQMGGGDDLPITAAASPALDESLFDPRIIRNEVTLPGIWPDDSIQVLQSTEIEWTSPLVVPQIPVAPVFSHQDEVTTTPAEPILEESEYLGGSIPPVVFTGVWDFQDENPTPVVTFPPWEDIWGFQNLSKDSVDGIIWVTDDDISPAFAVEEIGWKAEWLIPKPFVELYQAQDDRSTPAATPEGAGGLIYDEISIFRWYQEDPLPVQAATLRIDEEPWNPPTVVGAAPKALSFDEGGEVFPVAIEEEPWTAEFHPGSPAAQAISTDDEIVPQPIQPSFGEDFWPGSPTFLPRAAWEVQDSQDEVLPSIRDEEPFLGASYPLGPVVQVSDYSDDIVPQPPATIEIEETYWLQPGPPRDVIVGWQFPLDINEDFPELSTPPTPPRVEILGGDPVKKRKKSPREEIRDLLNTPSGEKIVLVSPSEGASLPEELRPVAKVVPAEYLPPIGVLPVSEPPPPAFSDEEMAEILALIHLGIL